MVEIEWRALRTLLYMCSVWKWFTPDACLYHVLLPSATADKTSISQSSICMTMDGSQK